jgi:hypothetical protein
MEMEVMVTNIEEKGKQLQEEMQKQNVYLNELTSSIKKLRHDRKVIMANIATISGAMQAYNESAKLMKASQPQEQQVNA